MRVAERRARQHDTPHAQLECCGSGVDAHAGRGALRHGFVASPKHDRRRLGDGGTRSGAVDVARDLSSGDRREDPDECEHQAQLDQRDAGARRGRSGVGAHGRSLGLVHRACVILSTATYANACVVG